MRRVVVVLLSFSLSVTALLASVRVGDLRSEHLKDPLGIDVAQPRLSWILQSSRRGQSQTAYQILVASSAAKLRPHQADLWDSGKVNSSKSVLVSYAGRALAAHAECYWKVRVWDKEGKASNWSAPGHWSMGPLQESVWKAQWIGHDGIEVTNYLSGADWIWFPEGEPQKAAAVGTNYFRRVVVLPSDREIKRAKFIYTGDNECRGWINGRDLGARNNYRTVKDIDITFRLVSGTNILGLTGRNLGSKPTPAGVVGRLDIQFASGPDLVIPTDDSWKVSNEEMPGWNERGFDDSAWPAAKRLGPAGMEPWGEVRVSEPRRLPARWLRKEFKVSAKISRAVIYFSGLGLSELYLNGQKVGQEVLSPGLTDYTKHIFYVTHDVTAQIRQGPNALGAVLGGGRFYADRSKVIAGTVSYGFPKLLAHLRLQHADGSITEVVSDESWKLSTDGPILANSEFDGEEYDARKEFSGWSRPGFDDSKWEPARIVAAPAGRLVAQMNEPIRVTQTLKPLSVRELKPGRFIFDMGQNMVGWCRLKVSGPAGTKVTLQHAETLNPDGSLYLANLRGALATDTYILKGKGKELWEPRFTYHGFRFVELTGFPGRPTLQSIEGRVVHDDLEPAGQFLCSNPLLNRIYSNIIWGVQGNYRSIPTDCPQRDERQGWLGDRSEESAGETYLFHTCALYAKWLRDMRDAQHENGSIPDVCPAYWPIYSDDVTWPSSSVIIPNTLYRYFADQQGIAAQYEADKNWIEHMLGYMTNGIIARDNYGDWCVPPEDPALIHSKDPARRTDPTLIATAYFYHDLRLMERYATLLCKAEDARRFGELADRTKAAFNDKFLNRERGLYDNGTQTSCVLPLAFGLVPAEQANRVFDHLVKKIAEDRNHIGTGLIGGQYLNRVLSEHGRADLAYAIATQRDYPSWGYMVEHGATTIWELWNGNTADPGMNSGNHVMLVGDLVIWLFQDLAGIAPDLAQPGFKHLVLQPHPVSGLEFVQASHRSPYGLLTSHWKRKDARFDWHVEIPPNTTATVYIPATVLEKVTESGRPLNLARNLKILETASDRVVVNIGSGQYHFVVN